MQTKRTNSHQLTIPQKKPVQLQLPFADNTLRDTLQSLINREVTLIITDNKTLYLSFKMNNSNCTIRLHRMFLSADNETIKDIAQFVLTGKSNGLIRQFIKQCQGHYPCKPARLPKIIHQGRVYNLMELFSELNYEYFGGRLNCLITWTNNSSKKYTKTKTLGSYHKGHNLIKINRILDSFAVPKYFIKYVIYHEMLHADIGVLKIKGRNHAHTATFKRREKIYKDYAKAQTFRFKS